MESIRRSATRPTGLILAVRYSAFAAIATSVNLLVQALALNTYQGQYHLVLAMGFGTIAGLLPKYALDKVWIFADGATAHMKKFTLYTSTAVVTTLLFWSTEAIFDRLGHGDGLHYLGAVIGLAMGYWLKYRLDRRYVFSAVS